MVHIILCCICIWICNTTYSTQSHTSNQLIPNRNKIMFIGKIEWEWYVNWTTANLSIDNDDNGQTEREAEHICAAVTFDKVCNLAYLHACRPIWAWHFGIFIISYVYVEGGGSGLCTNNTHTCVFGGVCVFRFDIQKMRSFCFCFLWSYAKLLMMPQACQFPSPTEPKDVSGKEYRTEAANTKHACIRTFHTHTFD